MRRSTFAVVAAIGLLVAGGRAARGEAPSAAPSVALPPPVAGNVDISADTLEVDTKAESAVLSGNVVFAKGQELAVRCPKIEVKYESGGPKVRWARGTGGVAAEVKGVRAEAPELELDLDKQKLWLRGGVRLFRGQGWVAADGAEIDLATARVSMTNVKASLPVGNLKKP